MYSDKSYHIADNCRFCWMCRHVCPIGLRTGKEINTPRAKGLLTAMEKRGFPMDKAAAQAFYECTLCGSCSNDCATGFEPPVFIREARTQAAVEGLLPVAVDRTVKRILDTGVMFADYCEDKRIEEAVQRHEKPASILLLLGATARGKVPEMALNLIALLEKAKVDFTLLKEEPATGSELYDLIGAVEETRSQAVQCSQVIREVFVGAVNNIDMSGSSVSAGNTPGISGTGGQADKKEAGSFACMVVVLDSYLAETLKHQYPLWGCAPEAEVVTATAFVEALLEEGRLSVKEPSSGEQDGTGKKVTLHDSSRLARDLQETKPARSILKAAGCELTEMFLHGKLAKCCGSELFAQYEPALALQTGQGRWEDALRTGADILVTECPQAYSVLARTKPEKMELTDLFTSLFAAC